MPVDVSGAYDAMAERYAALFLDALDGDADARVRLAALAETASRRQGPVADLGCGPGHVVDHLSRLGLDVVGYDLSPGQLAQARTAFPGGRFERADLTALDLPDSSLGGIVSRYSIIHLPPPQLPDVFEEWMRVLEPEAPVLLSFFGSRSAAAHGTPFDHKVVTAFELDPTTIARQLRDAGFVEVAIDVRPPPPGERPLDQATILGHKPA